jgi:hypothetical protein
MYCRTGLLHKTIRGVVTSAAESETAGVYGNGQETIAVRCEFLEVLGFQGCVRLGSSEGRVGRGDSSSVM